MFQILFSFIESSQGIIDCTVSSNLVLFCLAGSSNSYLLGLPSSNDGALVALSSSLSCDLGLAKREWILSKMLGKLILGAVH